MTQLNGHDGHVRDGDDRREEGRKPMLIIVMGVSGTGKSTIAKALNKVLEMPYIEGDDLHPPSNIEKMSNGQPLGDADREPWLALIRTTAEHMIAEQEADPSFTGRKGVMVTCSSLKRYYREILRGRRKVKVSAGEKNEDGSVPEVLEPSGAETLPTYFVYIKEEEKVLRDRMAKREGHFFKGNLLDSQLATLESPEGEEGVVVIPLDATTEEQVQKTLEGLRAIAGPL